MAPRPVSLPLLRPGQAPRVRRCHGVLHPGDPGVPRRDWSATGCCRGYRDFCVLRCARASFVFPCLIIELCHFLWWIGYGRGEPPPRAARPATGVGTLPAPRAAEPPPEAVRAVRVAYRRRGAALTVPGRDRAAGEVWTETRADVPPRAAFCGLTIQSRKLSSCFDLWPKRRATNNNPVSPSSQ